MNYSSESIQIKQIMPLTPRENDAFNNLYNIDGVTCRGVTHTKSMIIKDLFSKGIIDILLNEKLLTPSKLVQHKLNEFPIYIEQNELPSPILGNELSPSIRRDAALMFLKIAKILIKYDFALNSFDLSNLVLNNNGRPVLHNLEIITKTTNRKFPFSEFHANFLGPLRLIHNRPELVSLVNRSNLVSLDEYLSIRWPFLRWIVRRLSSAGSIGIKFSKFYQRLMVSPYASLLVMRRYKTFFISLLREKGLINRASKNQLFSNWSELVIKDLYNDISKFKFEKINQRWTDYHAHLNLANILNAGEDWERYFSGPREKALIKVLDSVKGETLLDIGANNGYFSLLAANKGYITTAVDYDIGSIDNLYRMLVNSNSKLNIRPLIFDFVNPDLSSPQRLKSDVVIALGFVHHMRLVELLPWSVIAERLASYTRKVLVTEFKNDTAASNAKSELTNQIGQDYSLENLLSSLKNNFKTVEVLGEYSMIGFSSVRTMIVCRR